MKKLQTAFLFDVDGVITNPKEKKVTELEIIDTISEQLKKGNIVAFNTGRSTDWAIRNVFPHMLKRASGDNHFKNLFIVGEKGGTWAEYKDGQWEHFRDETLSIPEDVKTEAKKMAAEEPFASIGGELDPKVSMYSWEMVDGMDITEYQKKRAPLLEAYEKLIKDKGLEDQFKVDATTIAIDIENKHVGKHLGAQRVLDWMKAKQLNAEHFITLGDSASDITMADHLDKAGKKVDFVFVGGKGKLNTTRSFPIHETQNAFGEGTREYLDTLS